MNNLTLHRILFKKEEGHSDGLRLIPALVLSVIIVAIGFLGVSYFLYSIHYPGFEKWLW